jgi:hypothetical protein
MKNNIKNIKKENIADGIITAEILSTGEIIEISADSRLDVDFYSEFDIEEELKEYLKDHKELMNKKVVFIINIVIENYTGEIDDCSAWLDIINYYVLDDNMDRIYEEDNRLEDIEGNLIGL